MDVERNQIRKQVYEMRKLIYTLISLIFITSLYSISICESYKEHIVTVGKIESTVPSIEEIFAFETHEEDGRYEFQTYESLGVTEKEFWYLVKICFTESNLENSLGQEAVVITIINRVSHEKFDDDIMNVINAPSQFGGRWVKSWGNYTQENVDNVINALSRVKNGELKDWEKEILFFHNPEVDSNSYADKYGLKILKVIGGHTFLGFK